MVASAVLTGTLDGTEEDQVRAGGLTLIITVSGDGYVADDGTFAAARQAILDGIASDRSEAAGFVALADVIPVAQVVRTSNTVCTVTFKAADMATYEITGPEKVTVTLPGSSLLLGSACLASGSATITPIDTDIPEDTGTIEIAQGLKHDHSRGRRLRQAHFATAAAETIAGLQPTGAGTSTATGGFRAGS